MPVYRRLEVADGAGVTVVRFLDRHVFGQAVVQEVGQELLELVESDHKRNLLLNFANVEAIGSQGLGRLVTLQKHVKAHGGKLKLCNIRPAIYELLAVTRLNQVFDIAEDESAALAAF